MISVIHIVRHKRVVGGKRLYIWVMKKSYTFSALAIIFSLFLYGKANGQPELMNFKTFEVEYTSYTNSFPTKVRKDTSYVKIYPNQILLISNGGKHVYIYATNYINQTQTSEHYQVDYKAIIYGTPCNIKLVTYKKPKGKILHEGSLIILEATSQTVYRLTSTN